MGCASLSEGRGLYVLLVSLDSGIRVGGRELERGAYAYVGSAGGPGGLRGRVCRHARRGGKVHWHIDRLLARGRAIGAYVLEGTSGPAAERELAVRLARALPEAAPGFGNTDTGGPSHLFRLDPAVDLGSLLGAGWRYVDLEGP